MYQSTHDSQQRGSGHSDSATRATSSCTPAVLSDEPARICILNAALDTGNLGVQALGITVLTELAARLPNAHLTIFSGVPGRRHETLIIDRPSGPQHITYQELGCSLSRRIWKPGNLYVEAVMRRIGFGEHAGMVTRCLAEADLIVDCSAGDSFTTLYGEHRYRSMTYPKLMALEHRAPLVLLPQTYGPFDSSVHDEVRHILQRCSQVWARDERSATIAHQFGAHPVRTAADMAFCLPSAHLPHTATELRPAITAARTIGININGLLWQCTREELHTRFGIPSCYRTLMRHIVLALLDTSPDARIVLVPHVTGEGRNGESDVRACQGLIASIDPSAHRRIDIMSPTTAMHARALIASTCSMFIGARMHSCIAALSGGVPTCPIAYSDKTAGVFDFVECGQWVCDPRHTAPEQIVAQLLHACADRAERIAQARDAARSAQQSVQMMFDDVASLALMKRGEERRAA